MDVIRERGTLRVGYLPERLPFAFQNKAGDLVGFGMDLVYSLARDFDLTLTALVVENGEVESVPFKPQLP